MLRLLLTQLATTLAAAALAGLMAGQHAFFSALLGGLCCVVPNGLFALRLHIGALKPGTLSPMTFFCRRVHQDCNDGCVARGRSLVVSRFELAGAYRCFYRRAEKLHHLIV